MIHADLSDRQDGWREQLWTRRLTEDTFEVACLPFFTYGICHRDVVTIDSSHLLTRVVRKPGHRTLCVALVVEHSDRDQIHELQHGKVADDRPAPRVAPGGRLVRMRARLMDGHGADRRPPTRYPANSDYGRWRLPQSNRCPRFKGPSHTVLRASAGQGEQRPRSRDHPCRGAPPPGTPPAWRSWRHLHGLHGEASQARAATTCASTPVLSVGSTSGERLSSSSSSRPSRNAARVDWVSSPPKPEDSRHSEYLTEDSATPSAMPAAAPRGFAVAASSATVGEYSMNPPRAERELLSASQAGTACNLPKQPNENKHVAR
ncbi:DUF4265 domain-containing protein [Streptomyces sp. NPDC047981]|uniref:DUF4265 domain-containing protein n=1 Tax=Streptomyces sp. NPDC047981 TaxID=3154610 RepID=UPI00343CBE93